MEREIKVGKRREYIIQVSDISYDKKTNETLAFQSPKVIGELVRCKDCKYFEPDLMPIPYFEGDGVCCHEHWRLEEVGFEVKEIDFCSYGERKEE